MIKDLDIIQQLEQKIGKKLEKSNKMHWYAAGYVQNAQGEITGLGLYDCNMSRLPESITQLQHLTTLDLGFNQLSSLPERIADLQNLTALYLHRNQFSSVPISITKLHKLTTLHLHKNQLSSLPDDIAQLQNLTALDLSGNQFSNIPVSVTLLKNLRELYLSENQLTTVPASLIKLQKLQELNLSENQLNIIPISITKLHNLAVLDLRDNQISSIPASIAKLQNLKQFDLQNNQLTEFPPALLALNLDIELSFFADNGVRVENNPFKTPPVEIINRGRQAVLDYYKAFKPVKKVQAPIAIPQTAQTANPTQPKPKTVKPQSSRTAAQAVQTPAKARVHPQTQQLNEARVLIVGDGGAGKTSLLKRLLKQNFDPQESQTHGININTLGAIYKKQSIKLHCWDFGGQQIMHATHQFFLSKRSLYLLVLDSRRETDPEYWLKHIETFGQHAPVIILINKVDENPHFDLSMRHLRTRYPNVKHICKISCATQQGFTDLYTAIQTTLPEVELLNTQFPASWLNVKNALMAQAQTKDFTSYDHYLDLCHAEGIYDDSTQQTLINFLHDLGVVVHFPDDWLRETNVINPQWLTEAVYAIITAPQLAGHGKLHRQQLNGLLDPAVYPRRKHSYLLEVMRKFQLCYPLNEQEYLFPDLFPPNEPVFHFDDAHALRVYYDYDFLPKGIFTRLAVKLHRDIYQNVYWRHGILLKDARYASTALIETFPKQKRIAFHVTGEQAREYLTVLRFMLDDINRSYQLTITAQIPLPDNPEHTVSYDYLSSLLANQQSVYIPPNNPNLCYPINDLIGLIAPPQDNEAKMIDMLEKILNFWEAQESGIDEKSFLAHVDEVIKFRPRAFGLEVDVKEIVKKLFTQRAS